MQMLQSKFLSFAVVISHEFLQEASHIMFKECKFEDSTVEFKGSAGEIKLEECEIINTRIAITPRTLEGLPRSWEDDLEASIEKSNFRTNSSLKIVQTKGIFAMRFSAKDSRFCLCPLSMS